MNQEVIEKFFSDEVVRNAKDGTLRSFCSLFFKIILGSENSWKTIEGYISAIVKLHDESGHSLTAYNRLRLHQFKKGKRNDRAKKVSAGQLSEIKEARDPMSAELLRVISKLALKENVSYLHLFSILLWNLIARGDNVRSFHLRHISWSGNISCI